MADIRIKDLATTASTTASDDFLAVDGTTNGTRKLSAATPSFATSVTVPGVAGPTATDLTLTGGSTGASLVLGQGASGAITLSPKGTSSVQVSNGSTTGTIILGGGAGNGEIYADGASMILSAYGARPLTIYQNGSEKARFAATTGNLLIGTTTDAASLSGGLVINGSGAGAAASSTTTGALRVTGGVGVSGAIYANSVYGSLLSAGDGTTTSGILGANSQSNVSNLFLARSDYSWGLNAESDLRFYVTTGRTTAPGTGGLSLMQLAAGSATAATASVNISSTKSASSSTVGALTIGNGTAATNVGIGGGNINAGGTLTVGGAGSLVDAVTVTGAASSTLSLVKTGSGAGTASIQNDANLQIVSPASAAIYYRTDGHYMLNRAASATLFSLVGTTSTNGVANFTGTTASTGAGTGALQVAGGIYAGAASVFGGQVTGLGLIQSYATVPEIRVSSNGTGATANGFTLYNGSDYEASLKHQSTTGITTLDVGRNSSWGGKLDIYLDTTRGARFTKTSVTFDQAATFAGAVAVAGATVSTSTGIITPAATTAISSVRLPHGTAPTSPVNGDMWTTTAGLYVRINGVTVGPLS